MKLQTLKESMIAKVAAQFLLLVMIVSSLCSIFGVALLNEVNAFNGGRPRLQDLQDIFLYKLMTEDARKAEQYYRTMQAGDMSLEEVNEAFSAKQTNFSFMILDSEAYNERDETVVIFKSEHADEAVGFEVYGINGIHIYGMLNPNLPAADKYQAAYLFYQGMFEYKWGLVTAIPVSMLIAALLFIYLLAASGYQKGRGVVARPIDRVPMDLLLAIYLAIVFVLVNLTIECSFYFHSNFLRLVLALLCIGAAYGLIMWMILSFARRMKAKGWWRNTVLARLCGLIARGGKKGGGALRRFAGWSKTRGGEMVALLPLVWKVVFCAVAVILVMSWSWFMVGNWRISPILPMLLTIMLLVAVWYLADQICRELLYLKAVGERLAAGEEPNQEGQKVPALHGLFEEHAENLGKVREGMALAVEAQLRSERLKTELITNVSHDIKTPLTSIINYVDLLRREEDTEKQSEYIEVLDKHTKRLKKLTEDLLEVSKVSTGNVSVNFETVDLCESLNQAIGEYSERLERAELKTVVLLPEHPVKVRADGKHMWRVLDNLLSNVCKYSLPGTRVYCTLEEGPGRAQLQIKNVSKEPLNINPDELMERFVRGDDARSTEGSGLGLSIARSLTEVQEGQFRLEIDGDLFKVALSMEMLP